MDWIELVNGPGGALVLLILILVAGARGWWVFGREMTNRERAHEAAILDIRQDRDEWKRLALTGTDIAQKAVTAAAEKVNGG